MTCPTRTTVSGSEGFVECEPYDKHCSEWSIDIEADTYEDTNWYDWALDAGSKGWRTYISGLRGFSGSFSCYADEEPVSELLPGGDPVEVYFYTLYDTDAGNYYGYYGCVIVTATHPSATVDDLQAKDVDWQGTGALTIGDIGLPTTT
jgi:hypothetical protein